jgi:phosphoglycolate phosphatase
MPIELIIFDLDGTLIDSIHDIADAVNYTFEPYGVRKLASEEVAPMVGEGASKLIQNVLDTFLLSHPDKETLKRRLLEYYLAHHSDNTQAYPEVLEMLEALRDFKKALVTNKPENLTLAILDKLDLRKHFDMVIAADTMEERKPSPAPVLHVLSSLKVRPERAIIVGDSKIDVDTGKAASVRTVAVTYGYGQNNFHKEADFIIDSPSQLIDIVVTQ